MLTGQGPHRPLPEKHFAYLKRPGEFGNLAPAIFDTLKSVVESSAVGLSYITDSGHWRVPCSLEAYLHFQSQVRVRRQV